MLWLTDLREGLRKWWFAPDWMLSKQGQFYDQVSQQILSIERAEKENKAVIGFLKTKVADTHFSQERKIFGILWLAQ